MTRSTYDKLSERCHGELAAWFESAGMTKPPWFDELVPAALAAVPVGWTKVGARSWEAPVDSPVAAPAAWLAGHVAEAVRRGSMSGPVAAATAALILEAVPASSKKVDEREWIGRWGRADVDRRSGDSSPRLEALAALLAAEARDADAQAASASGRYGAHLSGKAEGLRVALSYLRRSDLTGR